MKIDDLVERLLEAKKEHGNIEVTILDGFNGGGKPRTINIGPVVETIPNPNNHGRDTEDIATKEGSYVTIGFGCY